MAPHTLRTDDMAAAQAAASSLFGPTRIVPTRRMPHSLSCIDVVRIGSVSIAQVDYGQPVEVVARGSGPRYVLQTLMSGSLQCHGHAVDACPLGSTLLYTPGADFAVSLGDPCRRLCVVIDAEALRNVRPGERATGGQVTPALRTDSPEGMRWRALVDYLEQELQVRRRSDVEEASHDRALEQWIVSSAALAYNARVEPPCASPLPRSVRRAMDFIAANSRERVALSQIASHAGISARALQLAFARHVGETPMSHLRRVRLAKARSALLGFGRRSGAVTRAALGEGFTHLGEFAAAYRRAYGETPSATLDRS